MPSSRHSIPARGPSSRPHRAPWPKSDFVPLNLPIPEVMITAEDVQRGKPDPQGFLLGAQRLGVSIGKCLVFEDSPGEVAAAKAAGASCGR